MQVSNVKSQVGVKSLGGSLNSSHKSSLKSFRSNQVASPLHQVSSCYPYLTVGHTRII